MSTAVEEVQNPEQVVNQVKQIPDMGRHLVMDFVGVPVGNLDVNSYDQIKKMFEESLDIAGIPALKHTFKIFEPQGVTMLYVLDHGHLTIHTWPEASACAIDFYHSSMEGPEKGWKQLQAVEEHICDTIGWEYCTSTITVPRGNTTRVQNYDGPRKTEILQGVKFVHREKTQYYDLRIYDTQEYGRILWLNGYIQLNLQFLEENYASKMCGIQVEKLLKDRETNQDPSKINILIIGGGDLLVAYYLVNKYGADKFQIKIVDQDERVTANVRQYFEFGAKVDEQIKAGHIETDFEEGSNFIAKLAQTQSSIYDIVVIDISSDAMTDDSPAQSLTTEQFYINLYKVLKPGNGQFVMNVYSEEEIPQYYQRWEKPGFVKCEYEKIEHHGRNFLFGRAYKA